MTGFVSGFAPRVKAVLGPTNTGKTHLAIERMLAHASGIIGFPLRLLARENYDRMVAIKGARHVALITGEEKIIPPRATYFVCTVEAMPLSREVEFLAVDEIQLCADPERGHVFTHRLLHARGTCETMLLGAATMAPLVRRLLPHAEIVSRDRFSQLTYSGPKKLTRLPRRTAVVAFSADQVYAIAELIRRQRGGAAVVMGSLSPRTRNAQVALYQSGEVDFLVATDAIGMGLNMDVDHVAFAGLRKFDGKRTRWLYAPEIGQIAGRAGRFRRDGTFGITADCPDMDEDLLAAVESHTFDPIAAIEWRSAALDFDNLPSLIRSFFGEATAAATASAAFWQFVFGVTWGFMQFIIGPVLGIVHRVIASWLADQAGVDRASAQCGAVTLIQRFGSALNLNVHFHMLWLDGVYDANVVCPYVKSVCAPALNSWRPDVSEYAAMPPAWCASRLTSLAVGSSPAVGPSACAGSPSKLPYESL